MGKTSHKAKTPPDDFKVTTPKNPLINNQAVTSIKNLTNCGHKGSLESPPSNMV